MIPKLNRFHGLNALSPVYRKGSVVREGALTLKYRPSKKPDYRLAVVVSKKVHKSAVVRNRIRRRLYEVIRDIKKRDGRGWPYDLVLTCFDEKVADVSSRQLRADVEKLLKKAQITT